MAISVDYVDGQAALPVPRPLQVINWQYVNGQTGGDLAGSAEFTPTIVNWIQDFF